MHGSKGASSIRRAAHAMRPSSQPTDCCAGRGGVRQPSSCPRVLVSSCRVLVSSCPRAVSSCRRPELGAERLELLFVGGAALRCRAGVGARRAQGLVAGQAQAAGRRRGRPLAAAAPCEQPQPRFVIYVRRGGRARGVQYTRESTLCVPYFRQKALSGWALAGSGLHKYPQPHARSVAPSRRHRRRS